MLKIAICDDEEAFGRHLTETVSRLLTARKISYEIRQFRSGEEFAGLNMGMADYQIVFLDINMEELDGISTARRLREFCKDTYVVFVTAFINYAPDGYEVDAVRYILKDSPTFEKSVQECIHAILEKMHYTSKVHTFSFKDGKKAVNEDHIVYIESNLHELRFYILNQKLQMHRLDGTLNHMEGLLDDTKFVRIHQSYLVNMKYIKTMKLQKAVLIDESELPIAKPRYKQARTIFADYKGII